MLRLPPFRYLVPRDLEEAVRAKAEGGPRAAYVAGGTDLLVKMKRRQQTPDTLIQLGHLSSLRETEQTPEETVWLGAGMTLAAVAADPAVREHWPAVAHAASGVATPVVRNMATLGGNVCLDTRCSFFDQSQEWREAIDFCLKKDGDACRVAGSSKRCWAIQSGDLSTLLVAMGAELELVGPAESRRVGAAAFYRDDGVRYLTKGPDELVSGVHLPSSRGVEAAFVKVSRRLSFDFPVLSVAVWIRRESPRAPVDEARVVLGAVGSAPVVVDASAEALVGSTLSAESIHAAADAATRKAKPLDNADETASWRKHIARPYVARALGRLIPEGIS